MCSYFTGAIFVNDSNIVLNGETSFVTNIATYGGTNVNVLFDVFQ